MSGSRAEPASSARVSTEYEVLGELGAGALAHVYKARRRSTGQLVAIKLMREEYWADAEARERLRREALAIRAIQSPHVCAIYDFDTEAQEAFIVMEYVEGTTLRAVLKSHPWTPADLSIVVGQIGEAIHAAHKHEIVHRDLKPENIMLTGTGVSRAVKVLDFGFAKLLEHERAAELSELTALGDCFGTPQYMSPEQIFGQALDTKVDLFALAVIAYELVGQRRPWNGATPTEVMVAVTSSPIPPLDQILPCLEARRRELEAFFARALSRNAAERPRNARDFTAQFNRALGVFRETDDEELEDPQKWFEDLTTALISLPVLDTMPSEPREERLHSQWVTRSPDLRGPAPSRPTPSRPTPTRPAPTRLTPTRPAPIQPAPPLTLPSATESPTHNRRGIDAQRRRLLVWVGLAFISGVVLTGLLAVLLLR